MTSPFIDSAPRAGAGCPTARMLIAHAPGDQGFCDALVKHLTTMQQQGIVEVWHPGLIPLGAEKAAEQRAAVERADVIVFLVSADLLADLDDSNEGFRRALERHEAGHTIVAPILVRAADLVAHPLDALTSLPGGGKPIAQRRDQDAAWAEVVAALRRLVQERAGASSTPDADRDGGRSRELVSRVARIARLRHPESELVELRAPAPFDGLVVVTDASGRAEEVEPIGVLDGPISSVALDTFTAEVEASYRRENPLLRSRIVHTDVRATDELFLRARRRGVVLETIDEYAKVARLDRYLDWQARQIDADPLYPEQLYIPQHAEARIRLDRSETEDALDALFQLLTDPYPRLVLVLGDFGTGKTYLMRQLCRRLAREEGAPPPVLVEMRSLEKSLGLDSLLAQHFQLAGAGAVRVDAFRYLLSEGHAALLFDGFDELAFRVSYDRVIEHFQTVLEAAQGKAKVVITSRTAHFLNDRDVELELARKASEVEGYRLIKLHPFDEGQIRRALTKRLGGEAEADRRMRLLAQVEDLMGLSQNPRMLGFILQLPDRDLEEAKTKAGKITSAALYELLVTRWLKGEIQRTKEGRSALPLDLPMLWRAVTDFALLLWSRTEKGILQREIPDALWESLQRLDPSRTLDSAEARATLGSRSLLIRSDDGRFSFMHDSILDWLVARAAAAEVRERGDAPALVHQAMSDLMTDFFVALAGREPAIQWARGALAGSSDIGVANASRVLRRLRAEGEGEPEIRVIVDLSRHDLRGLDFSGSDQLRGAILEGADLSGATLVGADLSGAKLSHAALAGANLEGANLEGANLEGANLECARLVRAALRGARLDGAKLRHADLLGAEVEPRTLDGADLWGACPPRPALAAPANRMDLAQEGSRAPMVVAVDAEGRLLASGSRSGVITVWDLKAGKPLRAWSGQAFQVAALAFHPSDGTLASVAQDRTVRLWDVREGRLLLSLEGHRCSVHALAFSPGGAVLASGSADGTVSLWDARSGKPLIALEGHLAPVCAVAFSPDGATLVSGSEDSTLRLWDVQTGDLIRALTPLDGPGQCVAFSPDGALIACGSRGRTVSAWDARSGERLLSLRGHRDSILGVSFSPDGATLVSTSYDRTLRLWDARSGRSLRTIGAHGRPIVGFASSHDRRSIVTCAHETVRVWDARTGEAVRTLESRRRWILGAAFAPDGNTLATSSSDRAVRLWDVRSGRLLRTLMGHGDWVHAVVFSPEGGTLATSSSDRTVRLWDARSGELRRSLEGHRGLVLGVAFSPDGRTLASSSHDETLRLWDTGTGTLLLDVLVRGGSVRAVAFSPDGDSIVTGSDDGTVRVWDARNGELFRSLIGHQGRVRSLAFSSRGTLASGSHDDTVRLWDVRADEPLRVIEGHRGAVRCVAFSPDGSTLATGSQDMLIRLWDPANGALLRSIDSRQDSVRCLAFSPDGSLLASGSNDNTLRLWRVSDGACLAVIIPAAQGWAAYAPDGRYKVSGDVAGAFWHVVGLVRFEPGELTGLEDAFAVQRPVRLRESDPLI